MTIWEKIKMDAKERFMTYEALKGLYFMGAGLATIYISIFYQQYVIQFLGVTWGWYHFCEGLRKSTVNRIKQSIKQEKLIEERLNADSTTA